MRRIAIDIDSEEAVHWKPPNLADHYDDYSEEMRDIVKAQSKAFFRKLMSSLSPEMRTYVTRTLLCYNYGAEDEYSFKCTEFDGCRPIRGKLTKLR